jgi:hydrocephalus-inducing protein
MKQDRVSDHINGKLTISHEGHPHKDIVPLQGEVCFPNLQILPPKIDFGCILNDTSKKKYLVLTNISEMDVAYEWSFLEDAPILDEADEFDEPGGKKKKKKRKHLPINEVFDILPVSGILQPGQTEHVEFTYYAGSGLNYNGMAVCSVDGGPDYDVPITGDSSFVSYKLSTNEIDYGEVPYNESSSKDFYIENIGKVPFEFNINLATVSRPGIIECNHMQGKVIAGERFKVSVKFFPGIPDNIHEMFLVECGHFPAERFTVKAVGIYPGCLLSFPRVEDDELEARFERTRAMLENKEVRYSAQFHGTEALRQMPTIPPKMVEKEKAVIRDTFAMDVEAECDRQLLCEKIVQRIDQTVNAYATAASQMHAVDGANDSALLAVSPSPKAEAATTEKKRAGARSTEPAEPVSAAPGGHGLRLNGASVNLENINIATYVCDFGNVIITKSAKKSFRLTNVGKIPITFNFDKKILNQAGITIEPDKAVKAAPNASVLYNVVYTTRKTSKFGRQRFQVPIDIKNGPQYTIDFTANLTIPELTLSQDTLDFERVCVNTRKTVKIRLENNKEVVCDWSFTQKAEPSTSLLGASSDRKGAEGERFQVWPHSGVLQPGQRQTVDVMFTPNADKPFNQKLAFRCAQNQKQFILNVRGQGINYQVELLPETIALGPVLPYDSSAIQTFEIRNPMDIPIELYSLDFDKQYTEEEDILRRHDNFGPSGSGEPLYLPLRQPGGEFWSSIRQQDDQKRAVESLREQVKAAEQRLQELVAAEEALASYAAAKALREANEKKEDGGEWSELEEPAETQEAISEERNTLTERKGELEARLAEMLTDQLEVNMPPALKEEKRLNVILVGPEGSGRTTVANFLAQEHQRSVIRLDQLVDFWQKRGHAMGEEATKHLDEQAEKLAEALAEQEKRKRAKPKKGEVVVDVEPKEYRYLPKDLLLRMLQKRLAEDDCNAGAIFDCLASEYWPDEKTAIELVCDAVPLQKVEVVLFNFNRESLQDDAAPDGAEQEDAAGGEQAEVCTNYRYARRHDPAHIPKVAEEEKKEPVAADAADPKKRGAKAAPPKGRGAAKADKSKKDPAAQAAEEAVNKEAEEASRLKEADVQRKKAEEAARAAYRPKAYTDEEKAAWKAYVEDLQSFFAGIVMRQSSSQHQAVAEPENAGEEQEQQEEAKGEDGKPEAAKDDAPAEEEAEDAQPAAEEAEQIPYGERLLRE